MIPIQTYYRTRFPKESSPSRTILWKTLCDLVFQKYIMPTDTVMDVGAGYCEFINSIHCTKKYAVDINPDTITRAQRGVHVISTRAVEIPSKYNHSVDVVFMSNLLEHLQTKEEVLNVLVKIKKLLRPGGKLIILQPNIDLVHEKYWNFFDHNIVFNTESIREVLGICGYEIDAFIVRFLPYSTKHTRLPISPLLIRLYIALPEYLRPWAGQSLIIAA